jgi:hypothetical protein
MGETEGTMKPKVYMETTILSYLAARPSRDAVTAGRQVITRRWWETEREKYNLVVSEAVEAECERGDPETVKRRQELLEEVSLFPVDQRILEVASCSSFRAQSQRRLAQMQCILRQRLLKNVTFF